MKVVINRCFGGFSLSRSAVIALAATDCPHIERTDPKEYFGGDVVARPAYDWKAAFAKDQARPSDGLFGPSTVIDGKVVSDGHRSDPAFRACPHLVAIVETDPAASGDCASLAIVEIPDGVDFQIDEYDGMESIHEAHRSWS